jgi:hemerythrin-like domain-containing protein
MAELTQPLRDEHKELLPHIEALRLAADAVGEAPLAAVRKAVDDAHAFLGGHLLVHAEAEERALYPAVARRLGGPQATETMRRDHAEIRRLTEELDTLRSQLAGETLSDVQERSLRRVLYGLCALVGVHFAKEEEVYLPLLDRGLTRGEADDLFRAMGEAAAAARGHVA